MKQQLMFLNRVVTWEEKGIRYEPDPGHAEIVITQCGLRGAKGVVTPGVAATGPRDESDETNPPLRSQEASDF